MVIFNSYVKLPEGSFNQLQVIEIYIMLTATETFDLALLRSLRVVKLVKSVRMFLGWGGRGGVGCPGCPKKSWNNGTEWRKMDHKESITCHDTKKHLFTY